MRVRARSRNAPIHDWRLTLLPAAIKAGLPARALRLCAALCDHQRGRSFYPEVIVGLDDLASELGVDRTAVIRDNHRLVAAGLVTIISGGGKLPASRTGRANVYQLGARLKGEIASVYTVAAEPQYSVAPRPLYGEAPRIPDSGATATPPLRGTSYPSGGSGERTADLTVGPPSDPSSSVPIAPQRFRDLIGVLNHGKDGVVNAL